MQSPSGLKREVLIPDVTACSASGIITLIAMAAFSLVVFGCLAITVATFVRCAAVERRTPIPEADDEVETTSTNMMIVNGISTLGGEENTFTVNGNLSLGSTWSEVLTFDIGVDRFTYHAP